MEGTGPKEIEGIWAEIVAGLDREERERPGPLEIQIAKSKSNEEEYPDLDLYRLAVIVKYYLTHNSYSFVRAVYLCRGAEHPKHYGVEDPKYILLYEIPKVPEDMAELHNQFMADLWQPELEGQHLYLPRAYKDSDLFSPKDWMCYEVKEVKDIEKEPLHNFVQPDPFICLCSRKPESTQAIEDPATAAALEGETAAVAVEKLELESTQISQRPSDQGQARFIYARGYWNVTFQNVTDPHVENLKGMQYIAHLLTIKDPGVSAAYLSQLVNKPSIKGKRDQVTEDTYETMTEKQLEEEGIPIEKNPGKKISIPKNLKQEVKDILEALDDDEEAVRKDGEAKLKEFFRKHPNFGDALADELARKRGRPMPDNPSDNDLARRAINNAVKRAYTHLNERGFNALATHLESRLHIGRKCYYASHPENIDWLVKTPYQKISFPRANSRVRHGCAVERRTLRR